MSMKQNLFVSVFVHKCLMMLNDAEYTTFKMIVTQMSNYLFVISFQLMFYKTLRYRLARPLRDIMCMDQRHGGVSSVRSKSNALLAYVSNFLTVFFTLG